MEHHTYAKSGSKKWSAQEKRDLVEQRIAADDLFSKYSPKHAEPWKKFREIAKIGDYSENALRKQWFSMVQRYRVHKANAVGKPLNRQTIEELNQEWEFFGQIHAYMNQKTADLHSYALKEPNVEPPNNNLAIASVYSCDESQLSPLMLGVLNDHNFGERSPPNGNDTDDLDDVDDEHQQHQGNQENNEELNRLLAEASTSPVHEPPEEEFCMITHEMDEVECGPVMIGGEVSLSNSRYNDIDASSQSELLVQPQAEPLKIESHRRFISEPKKKRIRKGLSQKEKYYRHRRHFEQRMEKRLAGICTVMASVIGHTLPNVNVKPLLDFGSEMATDLPSPSSSENEDEDDEEEEDEETF